MGWFALADEMAARTSSGLIPYLNRAWGFSSTRTAGLAPPPRVTSPTPSTWLSFCCRMVAAASYIWPLDRVGEVSDMIRIGASAGLNLR